MEIVIQNLISPIVLCFALGMIAAWIRSDLEVPPAIYQGLSLYKDKLIRLIRKEGATGYTLIAVEGEGSRGVRASEFEGRNVQIETIVSPETAQRIFDQLAEHYLEAYAVIAYSSDVEVLRGAKFVEAPPSHQDS